MQKRLFTFGCSFTRYKWPTWADALAPQFDQHYNFAEGGAGNSFILWSIAEAHARHDINHNDTVIVMWTSCDRQDHYEDGWQTVGAQLVDVKGSIIRDCANIQAAQMALNSTTCEYYFLSMIDLDTSDTQVKSQCDIILQTYGVLGSIKPSVHTVIYKGDWHNAAFDSDYHPTPQQHIDYLDEVLPELPVDGQTRLRFAAIDKRVRNGRWTADEHWYDGYCVDRF